MTTDDETKPESPDPKPLWQRLRSDFLLQLSLVGALVVAGIVTFACHAGRFLKSLVLRKEAAMRASCRWLSSPYWRHGALGSPGHYRPACLDSASTQSDLAVCRESPSRPSMRGSSVSLVTSGTVCRRRDRPSSVRQPAGRHMRQSSAGFRSAQNQRGTITQ